MVNELKAVLNLRTALDAGCGVGFFAKILREAGLNVHAFDGRVEDVKKAASRFPQVAFEQGDIQSSEIRKLGEFVYSFEVISGGNDGDLRPRPSILHVGSQQPHPLRPWPARFAGGAAEVVP